MSKTEHTRHHGHEVNHHREKEHECGTCYHCSKFSPLSLALAAGIVFGLGTFVLGLMATQNNWGLAMVHIVGSVYKGFAPGIAGAAWGGLWGFVDGFISGLL